MVGIRDVALRDRKTVEVKTVGFVINKFKSGEWTVDVKIQRSADAWSEGRVKENLDRMVETNDAGTFHVADYFTEDGKRIKIVYDGKQRTVRLVEVYDGKRKLPASTVAILSGGRLRKSMLFSELPVDLRKSFLNMTAIIHYHEAPEEFDNPKYKDKYEEYRRAWNRYIATLFYRLNRTGKPLNTFESFGAREAPDYKEKIVGIKKRLDNVVREARQAAAVLHGHEGSIRGRPITFSESELVIFDGLINGMRLDIKSDGSLKFVPKEPTELYSITNTSSQAVETIMKNRQELIDEGFEKTVDNALDRVYRVLRRGLEAAYALLGPYPTKRIREELLPHPGAAKEVFKGIVISLGFASKAEVSRIVSDYRDDVFESLKEYFGVQKLGNGRAVATRIETVDLYTTHAQNSTKIKRKYVSMYEEVFRKYFPEGKPYTKRRHEANVINKKKRQEIPEDVRDVIIMDHRIPVAVGGETSAGVPRLKTLDNPFEHENGYL